MCGLSNRSSYVYPSSSLSIYLPTYLLVCMYVCINFMDCILLCMKYQVINIIAVNTTLFFNNLFVVYKLGYMFRPQFLVIIKLYMNASKVINYMEYNTDCYTAIYLRIRIRIIFHVYDHFRCVHVRPDDDQKLWSKHVA
jgi:hypothetical protein